MRHNWAVQGAVECRHPGVSISRRPADLPLKLVPIAVAVAVVL